MEYLPIYRERVQFSASWQQILKSRQCGGGRQQRYSWKKGREVCFMLKHSEGNKVLISAKEMCGVHIFPMAIWSLFGSYTWSVSSLTCRFSFKNTSVCARLPMISAFELEVVQCLDQEVQHDLNKSVHTWSQWPHSLRWGGKSAVIEKTETGCSRSNSVTFLTSAVV